MSQYIIWPIFFACVRAGLQWTGGFLYAGGYVSNSQEAMIAGAGATVAGILWSIWQKVLANQRIEEAHAAPGSSPGQAPGLPTA